MSKTHSKSTPENLPTTDFFGAIDIAGKKIPCAVLFPDTEEPIRVFVQREMLAMLTGTKTGKLERYLKAANLQNFIPEKFKNKPISESVIKSKINGQKAYCFIAPDLIDICNMYLQARTAGVLRGDQIHLAAQAEIIVIAFAKTGVVGVIDNVTGYEEFRPRFALNAVLNKYIAEEARKWVKRFPDRFYQLIFKLNRWTFNEETINKKPGIIGKWTNQIIYARFPKGVLAKLQDKNPITEKGYRKYKHHTLLTDIGNDELKEYLSNAMFLMESCANWSKFKRALARATGQPYDGDLFED